MRAAVQPTILQVLNTYNVVEAQSGYEDLLFLDEPAATDLTRLLDTHGGHSDEELDSDLEDSKPMTAPKIEQSQRPQARRSVLRIEPILRNATSSAVTTRVTRSASKMPMTPVTPVPSRRQESVDTGLDVRTGFIYPLWRY